MTADRYEIEAETLRMVLDEAQPRVANRRRPEPYQAYWCPLCGSVTRYWPTIRDHVCRPNHLLREPTPWSLDDPVEIAREHGAVSQ